MRLISHPFRLTPTGHVATVEQNSSQAIAEQVAMYALTHLGERVMIPAYGITDSAFGKLDPSEIALGIGLFGPNAAIDRIEMRHGPSEGQVSIDVLFGE